MVAILDEEHFYKVDGDFILTCHHIVHCFNTHKLEEIYINIGILVEKMKNLQVEEIK